MTVEDVLAMYTVKLE